MDKNKQLTPIQKVTNILEDNKDALMRAIPNHIKINNILQVALTVAETNPALLRCSPNSFLSALIKATSLGLPVCGELGLAYLVPYGSMVQLIVGYKGFISLAHKTAKIAKITSEIVRSCDLFDYEIGTQPVIRHKPKKIKVADDMLDSKITHAYSVVTYVDGSFQFVVLDLLEILKLKSCSPSGNSKSSPWTKHFDQMAKKSAVRQLAKMIPMSIEDKNSQTLAKAIRYDEATESGFNTDIDSILNVTPENDIKPDIQAPEAMKPESAPKPESPAQKTTKAPPQAQKSPEPCISTDQQVRLFTIAKGNGHTEDYIRDYISARYGYKSTRDIQRSYYDAIIDHFNVKKVK